MILEILSNPKIRELCQSIRQAKTDICSAAIEHCKATQLTDDKSFQMFPVYCAYAYKNGGLRPRNNEAEPNDVNFFDYDGTLLYSYSATEFASLTSTPSSPYHIDINSQAWNWTLQDAKVEVSTTGKLNIGLSCCSVDGDTHFFVHIPDDNFELRMNIILGSTSSTVEIDFGDESDVHEVTGESSNDKRTIIHNYLLKGDYEIILSISSGKVTLGHTDATPFKPIFGESIDENTCNARMCSVLYKVYLGNSSNLIYKQYSFHRQYGLESITIPQSPGTGCQPGKSMFRYCHNLRFITYPNSGTCTEIKQQNGCYSLIGASLSKNITTLTGEAFYYCYSLKYLTIPSSVSTMTNGYNFECCYNLQDITVPPNTTTIGANSFYNCHSLKSITIPASVTSLNANYIFRYTRSLEELKLLPTTPPTLSASAFNDRSNDAKFYVPILSWGKYRTATNWTNIFTTNWAKMEGESNNLLPFDIPAGKLIMIFSYDSLSDLHEWELTNYASYAAYSGEGKYSTFSIAGTDHEPDDFDDLIIYAYDVSNGYSMKVFDISLEWNYVNASTPYFQIENVNSNGEAIMVRIYENSSYPHQGTPGTKVFLGIYES